MTMTTAELIKAIFEVCIIPLLGVLTTYAVKWVRAKSAQLATATDNELAQKYIGMLTDTVTACVIATNQTYVDALKREGSFDAAAQKAAFELTSQAVLNILSSEAKTYLASAFGDLNTLIANSIEAEVKLQK